MSQTVYMHIHRDTHKSFLKRKKYIKTVIVVKGTNHEQFQSHFFERSVEGQIVFSAVQTMHPSYNYSNLPLKWESSQRQTSMNGRDCSNKALFIKRGHSLGLVSASWFANPYFTPITYRKNWDRRYPKVVEHTLWFVVCAHRPYKFLSMTWCHPHASLGHFTESTVNRLLWGGACHLVVM